MSFVLAKRRCKVLKTSNSEDNSACNERSKVFDKYSKQQVVNSSTVVETRFTSKKHCSQRNTLVTYKTTHSGLLTKQNSWCYGSRAASCVHIPEHRENCVLFSRFNRGGDNPRIFSKIDVGNIDVFAGLQTVPSWS